MATINYPSRGFLRTSLHLLREGNGLTICVRPGWRSVMLEKEMVSFPSSALEAHATQASGKKPPSLRMSLLMMPLSIVHHFALSGDFVMSFRKNEGIEIIYSRGRKDRAKGE